MAWNLPGALGDAACGPALYGDTLDLETTPPGRIEPWVETKSGRRSFFLYWIMNPLGDRTGDQSGTIVYLETDMPAEEAPLRRNPVSRTQDV